MSNPPGWYTVPVHPAPSNSLATAGMVLGILGVVIQWGGVLTLTAGVLAVIFGVVGVSQANRLGGLNSGRAVAAIVLGCITVLAYLFWGLVTSGIFWLI